MTDEHGFDSHTLHTFDMNNQYQQQIQILEKLMEPNDVSHYSWFMIFAMSLLYFALKREVKY
jgi:hypothetical protein